MFYATLLSMNTSVVAVLRGGPSPCHKASLRSGQTVLDVLYEFPGTHRDVYIDREGTWYERGRPVEPEQVLTMVDVVINALHGPYGEDGTVQKILARHNPCYSGSAALGAFLASHKALARDFAGKRDIPTPRAILLESEGEVPHALSEGVRRFGLPLVVKSVFGEGSHWVRIATTLDEVSDAVEELLPVGPVLIEEFVRGKEASMFLLEDFRGKRLYTFPPHEIRKTSRDWHTSCPGSFSLREKELLEAFAQEMFRGLGLRHYARIDFIVTPRNVYFLEANALPKFSANSLFAKTLASVGATEKDFVLHVKDLASQRK